MKAFRYFCLFVLMSAKTAFAEEPTLRELELRGEILQERAQRMNADFEHGKLQIEAGILRQGLAVQGMREVKAERTALEMKMEKMKKQTGKKAEP